MAGATMSMDVTVVLKGDGISSVYDFRKNTKQIKTTFSSLLVPNLKNIKIIVTPLEKGVHFFATKQGGKMPTWYTRYFIYQPSTRVIRYYTPYSISWGCTEHNVTQDSVNNYHPNNIIAPLGTIEVQNVEKSGEDQVEITDKSGRIYYLRSFSRNTQTGVLHCDELVDTFNSSSQCALNNGIMRVHISMVCDIKDSDFITSQSIADNLREALKQAQLISSKTIIHVEQFFKHS